MLNNILLQMTTSRAYKKRGFSFFYKTKSSLYYSIKLLVSQSIMSKPQYGTNAFGIRIPSGVWLFSSNAATILGNAKAEPFKV